MKLPLPRVTITIVDDVSTEQSIKILTRIADRVAPHEIQLHTSLSVAALGIRVVKTPPITSIEKYANYVTRDLVEHITTDFCLVCQSDGYIVNVGAWSDDFLAYDYIGALWPVSNRWAPPVTEHTRVGNGGFSLRSHRLMEFVREEALKVQETHPEDAFICRTLHAQATKAGLKFAAPDVAARFSVENTSYLSSGYPFGFHGKFTTDVPAGILNTPFVAVTKAWSYEKTKIKAQPPAPKPVRKKVHGASVGKGVAKKTVRHLNKPVAKPQPQKTKDHIIERPSSAHVRRLRRNP